MATWNTGSSCTFHDVLERLFEALRSEYRNILLPRINTVASNCFPTAFPYVFVYQVNDISQGWDFSWETVELTDFLS